MSDFRWARDFLLANRTDEMPARADFAWPDPAPFNWAIDWLDAELAGSTESRERVALRIVDATAATDTSHTCADFSRPSNQVANLLRRLDLRRGDRRLLLLGNVPALWESALAAMKLGVAVVPATALLIPTELADRFTRGSIRAVLAGPDQLARSDGFGGPDVLRIAVGPALNAGYHAFEEALGESIHFEPDGPTAANDPLLLYFTSGTTAQPKLVCHTHRSCPVGSLSTMYRLGLQPGDVHCNVSSPGWAKHGGPPLRDAIPKIDWRRNKRIAMRRPGGSRPVPPPARLMDIRR